MASNCTFRSEPQRNKLRRSNAGQSEQSGERALQSAGVIAIAVSERDNDLRPAISSDRQLPKQLQQTSHKSSPDDCHFLHTADNAESRAICEWFS